VAAALFLATDRSSAIPARLLWELSGLSISRRRDLGLFDFQLDSFQCGTANNNTS